MDAGYSSQAAAKSETLDFYAHGVRVVFLFLPWLFIESIDQNIREPR